MEQDYQQSAPVQAPEAVHISMEPKKIGELFKDTFAVIKARIGLFFIAGIIMFVITFIIISVFITGTVGLFIFGGVARSTLVIGLLAILLVVISIIFQSWPSLMILNIANDAERRLRVKDLLVRSFKKIHSFIWIGFLEGLVIGGGYLILLIFSLIFLGSSFGGILTLFLMIGAFAWAIISGVWFAFSPMVLVAEGLRGIQALKRSKNLVGGKWSIVFSRFFCMGFILGIIGFISNAIFEMIPVVGPILGMLANSFIAFFMYVYTFVLYKDFKRIKQPTS
ncbi:hypothetical protein KKC63_00150 [Patescibacteria group bacterium]|nr:hypothetical protein [Patescibacteria group bacterium]MBU4023437.1 hypothetical protein [Patescibacteria group bacterium]MBU4078460.1 hypothetical protein [Patescibacteria group bacterium]